MRVAFAIGALQMDDRHVGGQRFNSMQPVFSRVVFSKWRVDLGEKRVIASYIATERGSRRQKWHAHGRSLQRQRHREVGQVHDFQSALFDLPAEIVSRAHHHIAHPGRDDLLRASRRDQLIEENVRDRPDQGEAAFFLPHDFVARRKRNHLFHLQT